MWPGAIDCGKSSSQVALKPPPSIAAFRAIVDKLHFTNGSDKGLVADIYELMMRTALGGTKALRYGSSSLGDADVTSLAESLDLCTRLEVQCLTNNAFGDTGLESLAQALGKGAALYLKELWLGKNDFNGVKGLHTLGKAEMPALETLTMTGASFSLSALVEGMLMGAWPLLKTLKMEGNKQASDEGAEAFARALERGAMPKLEMVIARDGGCSEVGKATINKARPSITVHIEE